MKIAFLSDTHIDFYISPKLNDYKLDVAMDKFIDELWLKTADVLILAGDNSHYPKQNKLFLEKIAAKKIYKKIFITFGNHDLYLTSNTQRSKYATSWDKVLELKAICEEIDTIEFIDGNIVEVDGVKFGGTSMWYDMSYAKQNFNMNHLQCMQLWKQTMNDANLIVGKDYPPEINESRADVFGYGNYENHYKKYTFDPIKFFKQEEEKMLKIVEECDVFISHVGPVVPPNLPTQYQNAVTGFYYFNGEWILQKEKAPKLWFFGHTHDRYEFKFNNTWVMCNPLGYKSENINAEVEVIDLDELY